MKRPAFQFYPKDWRGNQKLRRCSFAAKGAWIEILCMLHDSEEYGVARFPLAELIMAAGVPAKCVRELVNKGVLKGGDKNVPPYKFAPIHAGKRGPEVTLLEHSAGPMWYCSRFVRDEYIRGRRGMTTRFGVVDNYEYPVDNIPPNPTPKGSPKPPFGDGLAVASASAINKQGLEVETSSGWASQLLQPNRAKPGTANPRPDGSGQWRRDPVAAERKLRELGIPQTWSIGKSHAQCVERIATELARLERHAIP